MRIGILGSGLMGGKLGTLFARSGHDVVFSYARSMEKLKRLAKDAGATARAGTPREAAEHADALLLAVHWSRIDDVLKQAGDLSGKVILTCSLPMDAGNTGLVISSPFWKACCKPLDHSAGPMLLAAFALAKSPRQLSSNSNFRRKRELSRKT